MSETYVERVAVVTGGTGGIGGAIADALAAAGFQVTVTGRTRQEAETFAGDRGSIDTAALDVTDDAAVVEFAARFLRLDVLVNCAGMILRDGLEHEPSHFARVVDVNLNGMMRMCSACRPALARAGGSVVNLASMLSYFGSGTVPAYSASKGGVGQLTKSLAIAWADDGIRVNAVAPGWIRTPLTDALFDDEKRSASIVGRTPLKRWGRPEDVAGAVLFLCSPSAEFVTGVILPVDGGYSIA